MHAVTADDLIAVQVIFGPGGEFSQLFGICILLFLHLFSEQRGDQEHEDQEKQQDTCDGRA